MNGWLRLAAHIDRLNDLVGRGAAWLVLAMVLIGAFNAVARYLGRSLGITLTSNAFIELQWYLFSLVFLLGSAYTLRHNRHVRVDVVYSGLSARTRAWINLLGIALLLVPFCVVLAWVSGPSILSSWERLETSPDPGGLPRYPLKTVVPIALVLLLLQGLAIAVRQVATLRGVTTLEDEESSRAEGL